MTVQSSSQRNVEVHPVTSERWHDLRAALRRAWSLWGLLVYVVESETLGF